MAWLDRFFTSKNYNTLQEEGADLPPQPTIDFVGTGVAVTDDPTNTRTLVTITAGGSVDFAAVQTALAAASSSVAFNAQKLTGVADPASAQDAATKAYVDASAGSVTASSSTTFTNKSMSGATNTFTAIPISTAIGGLGSNVATFLGTPSSANLRSALTDETGTGAAVFATAPTLSAPTITSPSFGSSTIGTSGYFTTSGTVSTVGQFRLAHGDKITYRNSLNSADATFMHTSSDTLYIGLNSSFTDTAFAIIQCPSSAQYIGVASNYFLIITNNLLEVNAPILGYSGAEFGLHGSVDSAMGDANYTAATADKRVFTVSLVTLMTSGRTMTWPHPSSADRSYRKAIRNTSTTTQTVTISTGTGTTQTLATNTAQIFEFTPAGVRKASATWTP